jgi:hypothetical protein
MSILFVVAVERLDVVLVFAVAGHFCAALHACAALGVLLVVAVEPALHP